MAPFSMSALAQIQKGVPAMSEHKTTSPGCETDGYAAASPTATHGETLPTVELLRIAKEAGADFDTAHPECLCGFSMLKFAKLLKEHFAASETAAPDQVMRDHRDRIVQLEDALLSIGDFANGQSDVGNIIAKRCRAALGAVPSATRLTEVGFTNGTCDVIWDRDRDPEHLIPGAILYVYSDQLK